MKWFPLLLVLCLCPAALAITLADNGKTNYTIVHGPTPAEKTAALELADYLHQVTGATFPIAGEPKNPMIQVAYSPAVAGQLSTDSIIIRTDGDNLILSGGFPRGPMNAVHT